MVGEMSYRHFILVSFDLDVMRIIIKTLHFYYSYYTVNKITTSVENKRIVSLERTVNFPIQTKVSTVILVGPG